MLRNTRRRQQQSAAKRHTRKQQQRGGDLAETRSADWVTELGTDFSLITGSGSKNNKQYVAQYLDVIRRQDELFAAALRIIGRKLNIDVGDANAVLANVARIDASGAELFEYIIDVERMIQFKEDGGWTAVRSGSVVNKPTKLQTMYGEPLSTLLLFPSRLNNMFVIALANIIRDLSDPANPLIGQAAANIATHPILADQFMAYAHSTAYTLTARDLRDGYFLNQAIADFQLEIKDFWGDFITGVVRYQTVTDAVAVIADKGAPCKTALAGEDSWGIIAAKIFRLHQLGKLGDMLTLFADCTTSGTNNDESYTPPSEVLDIAFDDAGTTLRKLYRNMDDVTLQFILQLIYTIQKLIHHTQTMTMKAPSSLQESEE